MKKIIVIDDEYSVSGLLFQHLSKKGYEVVALTNGAWITEGRIRTDGVDIVVTDYHMKRIDGEEVIRYLRENGYKGRIILSSSVDISSVNTSKIDAIIEKPYTLQEFTSLIENLS